MASPSDSDSSDGSTGSDAPASAGTAEPADPSVHDWLTLDDDESIVWAGQPHRYSLASAFLVGIPLSLVLVGLVIIASAYLWRENTTYVVTTEALYAKSGILSRDVQRIDFEKVQNISYSQGPLGAQLGYGNVDISTAGGSGVEMQFQSVPDPKAVSDRIKRRVRSRRPDEDGEERTDVLEDILTELRAIRAAVETDGAAAPQADAEFQAPDVRTATPDGQAHGTDSTDEADETDDRAEETDETDR